MRQKSGTPNGSEEVVKDIRRATRKHYSAEDKIRIVLDGLRGEYSIAELCRREAIAKRLYYSWSKEFLEAGQQNVAPCRCLTVLLPSKLSDGCLEKDAIQSVWRVLAFVEIDGS